MMMMKTKRDSEVPPPQLRDMTYADLPFRDESYPPWVDGPTGAGDEDPDPLWHAILKADAASTESPRSVVRAVLQYLAAHPSETLQTVEYRLRWFLSYPPTPRTGTRTFLVCDSPSAETVQKWRAKKCLLDPRGRHRDVRHEWRVVLAPSTLFNSSAWSYVENYQKLAHAWELAAKAHRR